MIKITLMEMIIDWCIMIWYPISELENPWICVKLWKTYLIFLFKSVESYQAILKSGNE